MKKNIIGLLVILVVANLSFYLFLVGKTQNDIRELEIERLTGLTTIKEIRDIKVCVDTLGSRLDEARQGLVNLNSLLVDERELVDLVAEITRIANVSGVELRKVQYEPQLEASEGQFRHIFVNLPVRGGYEKIRTFIFKLETIKKLIRIKDLTSIQVKPGEGNELDLRLRLVVYFKADLEEAVTIGVEPIAGAESSSWRIDSGLPKELQTMKTDLTALSVKTFKTLEFSSADADTTGEKGEISNIFEPLFIEKMARQKVVVTKVEPEPPPPPPIKQAVVPAPPVQVVDEKPDLEKEKTQQWLDGFGFMGLIDRKGKGVDYFLSDGKDFYVVGSGDSLSSGEVTVALKDGYLLLKHTAYDLEKKLRIPETGISE